MSLDEQWQEAIKKTEIVRLPMRRLTTFGDTRFEYFLLTPSEIHSSDTVIRRGNLEIHKPALILPNNQPLFEGFHDADNVVAQDKALEHFFYLRGISFPTLKYKNEPYDLDLFEGSLTAAAKYYDDKIRKEEKMESGLLLAQTHSWNFSLLIFACCVIEPYIDGDLKALLQKIKRRPE